MKTFFTSDHHFGHGNMIKYALRPFSNVHEMNVVMTERWNEVVGEWDLVYHLGDLTLEDEAVKYLSMLNGRIHILRNTWHHDKRWISKLPARTFSKSGYPINLTEPMVVLDNSQHYPMPIVLCHYPFAEWDRKHYGAWHLHGHSHCKHVGEGKIMDVGVDCNNFYPVSLEQVADYMETR